MKILIIEDEAPAYRRLEKTLLELDPGIEILEVLDSVEDTVGWLKNHQNPDLILMDIQISDGLSFDIFERAEVLSPVIFITAFDEYLLKAFKVNSIDYLLKPIKKDDLSRALEKYKNLKITLGGASASKEVVDISSVLKQIELTEKKHKTRFLVKQGDRMLSIQVADIVCFQSKHGVVHLRTKFGKTYLYDFPLDELMQQLNPLQFYRANRQFIIGADYVSVVHKYFRGKLLVELNGFSDEEILVSSEKATAFKSWLDQ